MTDLVKAAIARSALCRAALAQVSLARQGQGVGKSKRDTAVLASTDRKVTRKLCLGNKNL
jgi:hypothetical protein